MGHGKNHVIDRRRFVQASSVAAAALALGATGCASSHPVAETGGTTTQFVAGTYQATALGKKSDITVEVVFSDTAIDSVRVVDHGETERIAAPAFEKIPEIIVASQSLAVDAVTGATLSSLALLSAVEDCARQADGDVSALKRAEVPKEQPTDEEIECDLAVIGAGISGMASALAAAQQGAKVVVFEKSSSMGGNALVSGGFIEYANAPEELRVEVNDGYLKIFQEVLQFNRDAGLDASLVDEVQQQWDDYYANGNTKLFSSPEFLALQLCMLEGNTYDFQHTYATDVEGGTAWLDTMQFPWMPLVAIPGYSWAHFSGSSEDVNGEGYFNVFEREMEGLDLRILFATPATELITESGRVTGVIGSSANGSTYTVRAKDGVVIASGGYADNQDMLKEHDKMWNWKDLDTFHCDNNYGHTGDGIRMATEAGAAFAELPFNQMVFPFVDTVLYATETTVGTTNESIYVNKAGKRFCDEGGSRTDMTIALMEQDGGVGFQVVDHDSSMITDGKTHTGMDVEYAIERGILYRADTLEELAGLMGVDEATFLKTVDDYNEMTRTFNDPEFGRSS
ncbi:FAD-dependent oxidoreductase, partial [Adlercreutzia equolifaciens]|uniref:FAD-dependent oxidoreductase n=2 Tax=Eggerthellaceae TaxID=1643826 RepID=UPI002671CD02